MSTKDIIERLNRAPAQSVRRRAPAESQTQEDTAEGNKEVETRVNRRVIRRRRVEKEDAPTAGDLPTAASTPRRVVRRPVRDEPAEDGATAAAAANTAAAEAEKKAAAEAAEAEKKAAAAAEAEKKAAAEAQKAAAESAEAEKKAAAESAEAEKKAAAESAEAEKKAAADAAEAQKAAAEAEKKAAAESAEAEKKAAAEAAPAEAVAKRTEEPVAAAPADGAADDAGPSAAAKARKGLPRLGGGSAAAFPGLGSAVVAPPPGYDPNDPMGNRRRAQEAARQSAEERAPSGPSAGGGGAGDSPRWRDERTAGPGAGPGDDRMRDRDRGRGAGRPKPRRRRRENQFMDDGFNQFRPRRRRSRKNTGPKMVSPKAAAHKRRVEVDGAISVSNLAHGMSVKATQVIKKLIGMGQMATMNDILDFETAQLVAEEFEYEAVDTSFKEADHFIDLEDDYDEEGQEPRPPVVTIMGHVDHGKTTLLDTIRKANVAAGEAGGITQHTSAYQVEQDGELITFIDTPGHEAFTEMRARGAQVTDIVVLVVAADDGIMPQTVEALNHAKASGVQIIVAVNKIDKPNASPERIRTAFMEHELIAEEFGGETMFVNVSALKGDGIPDLLDAINLTAEMGEFTANADRHAEGTVLEARLEKGRGTVANVLVQAGTLKQGDRVVMGTTWGRVRAMSDHRGQRIKEAGPSTPVEIIGLNEVPQAGDNFVVVESDKDAKALAEHRIDEAKRKALAESTGKKMTLEDLIKLKEAGELLMLNLIIKADVGGTLEAMKASVAKIDVEGTDVKILHSAVGGITESDITLAHTYEAIVIGFNVRPDSKARRLSDEYGVEVRTYRVIYEALEDIEKALKGLLGPTYEEKVHGTAEIRETFSVPKVGTIAGCRVMEGNISRNHSIRLLRDGVIVYDGKLASLRRFKDDVREVQEGYECGMNLEGFNDIKVGDIIEAYGQQEVEQA